MKENTFGATLRRLRKQKGLSVAKLALQISISPSYIYDLEHNRRTPSVPMLKNLATFFEVPFDDLLSDKKTAVVAAGNGGGNIVQINNVENNGSITQTVNGGARNNGKNGGTMTNEAVSLPSAVYSDLESVLRFRHEQPDLFELCANMKYTEKELRAIVSALLELRKKQE